MRVGVYSGSFDPVHLSHYEIVYKTLYLDLVDKVFVIPSFKHPYKQSQASFEDRINMLSIAFGGLINSGQVDILDVERFNESGLTYDLLSMIKTHKINSEISLIIGSDCWEVFDTEWKFWNKIINEFEIIVYCREQNYKLKEYNGIKKVSKVELPNILKVISSSNIRSKCLQGLSIDEECNILVSEYINQNRLYKEFK